MIQLIHGLLLVMQAKPKQIRDKKRYLAFYLVCV